MKCLIDVKGVLSRQNPNSTAAVSKELRCEGFLDLVLDNYKDVIRLSCFSYLEFKRICFLLDPGNCTFTLESAACHQ